MLDKTTIAAIACWVCLAPPVPNSARVEVLPGSHKAGLIAHTPSSTTGKAEITDAALEATGLKPVTVELSAGDLLIYSPWLVRRVMGIRLEFFSR